MKTKTKPATARIKSLLEELLVFSLNLYSVKGKDKTH